MSASGKNWIYPSPERTRFTKLLTVYAAAAIVAIVAWVLNVGQLYWMAGALGLLPLGSRLVASLEQRGLEVERTLPPVAHQGQEVRVRLTVHNRSPLPKLHLSAWDVLPRGLKATPAEALPLHLGPHGTDVVEYTLRLGRRGWHELDTVLITGTDPLGLAHEESRHTLPARVLVYPRVITLPEQAWPPLQGGGSAPIEGAQRQGEGTSFFGIREYRPGDPLRHVHWRTAARLGRLAVVEWEAEESRDTVLAIETAAALERDLGPGTTLDLAAGLAGSLASAFFQDDHAVRLVAPGTTGWEPTGRRGTAAMSRTLEELAQMAPSGATSLSAELRRIAPRLSPGATVCWITPSLGEQLVQDCRYLLAARLRPVVYALVDQPRDRATLPPALGQVQGMGVAVIPVFRDDELTRLLLS